ncbi:MAG TPA: YqgE/AlgH family protein [Gemmatimonadaceae bacterium]|nr:YqgE/AlgH family protein [Gemmatimonadaceae bacterium]
MFKRIAGIGAAVMVIAAIVVGAGRAADLSQAVILVASPKLAGSPFEQTVVLAAPLPEGGHVGFIVNRPTTVRLETLLADESPARNVKEPVYYGGPELTRGVFALMRSAPEGAGSTVALVPGIVAVLDEATIGHVIETTPDAARYFVGMMVWEPDQLADQVTDGLWDLRPADGDSVLPANASRLWFRLRGPSASAGALSL